MEIFPKHNKIQLVSYVTSYMAIKIIFIEMYLTWYIFMIDWIKSQASVCMVNSHLNNIYIYSINIHLCVCKYVSGIVLSTW